MKTRERVIVPMKNGKSRYGKHCIYVRISMLHCWSCYSLSYSTSLLGLHLPFSRCCSLLALSLSFMQTYTHSPILHGDQNPARRSSHFWLMLLYTYTYTYYISMHIAHMHFNCILCLYTHLSDAISIECVYISTYIFRA